MKPVVQHISQISPDQSVVCIVEKNEIPAFLKLTTAEKEYALRKLREEEETVFINSYFKCTYLIKLKKSIEHYRKREEIRKAAAALKKLIRSNNHDELVISSGTSDKEAVLDFAEGLLLSVYSFDKYRTVDDEEEKYHYPSRLLLHGVTGKEGIQWLTDLTDAVWLVRDLINEPVNHLNALALAEAVASTGKKAGFRTEVLTKGKIEALKMGGLLAVNRGSVDPPVFCILEWKPGKPVNSSPLVLIGKGVVYDSGGLNIKTGDYMAQMKGDMAGAAAVTGVFHTVAKSKLPLHIIGLIPATDNRPGGNAYTQGDIITMYNKMTVEVGNTDAEGRLILADAISYAAKYRPMLIIDIATLTGSAAMTFGNQAIAMMGNADRKFVNLLEECGREVYERVSELPFWEEYGDMIKSKIADVRNVGGREAGAITAGKFLEKFSEYPLIHLDIAGTGILKKDDHYRLREGPGSGVRLLSEFVRRLSKEYNKLK
ncbi:MAG: leucyl aminopeptidase family protein [Bacteroidales bacterium]|nr:leucyl aminopeptidase family protein [Bacteroidales bacterium]MBN2633236.1 leucyl aminopeptidase family protein [Bacteroidales bacterium]